MNGTFDLQFASSSERAGAGTRMKDDGKEAQLTQTPILFQPCINEQPADEIISISNVVSTRIGNENPLDDIQHVVASLPNVEEVSHRAESILGVTKESRTADTTQHRPGHSSTESLRSPTFLACPGDFCPLYTEVLPNEHVDTAQSRASNEHTLLTVNTMTEEPNMTLLQGAIARAGRACRERLRLRHSPISLHLMAREMTAMTDGNTLQTHDPVATHQGDRILVLASDTESSSFLNLCAWGESVEPREDPASYQTPALRRESPLNPQGLMVLAVPHTSDFFSASSSNVQNRFHVAFGVTEDSSNPNSNANQSNSRTDNLLMVDRSLNTPNMGGELYLHTGGLYSFGGTQGAAGTFRQRSVTRTFGVSPTSHSTVSGISGNAAEYPFTPLFSNNLDGNLIGEKAFLLSSCQEQIPPFRKPFDVTPLFERADYVLENATTPLVPVLPSSLPDSEEVVGTSQDSLTLGSISWLNSVVGAGVRRQHVRHGDQDVGEEDMGNSLEVTGVGGAKDSTGVTIGESSWNQQTTYIVDASSGIIKLAK
ncbi:hypothetical protein TraAM80_08767 [Trypanosoma rangeli]|uniref:Uncharacterized protein n=1 Tax=Trypanosoma rangeli TaxID=5698 RepID=A0A3R7N8L1_TRYRA|nr:uncharacterized protein TraAM80_08767 [Trypanosoma rangeli]RNE98541.1 hypothetical protein TraAM80_08767 [Trypanosoma rangeli]|eukprot:RNE98541.1 hypothetical protein TraAM80_08767 [Trypanosoma rangeli]